MGGLSQRPETNNQQVLCREVIQVCGTNIEKRKVVSSSCASSSRICPSLNPKRLKSPDDR
jgi:hypothetical protein